MTDDATKTTRQPIRGEQNKCGENDKHKRRHLISLDDVLEQTSSETAVDSIKRFVKKTIFALGKR